jgi:hypothetical protein
MLVDGRDCHLEQLRHLRLREPDRLVLEPALDARATVLRLVEDHARRRRQPRRRHFDGSPMAAVV